MTIAPMIRRLRPELDARQREVVGHTDGPLLVVAGPGSGKTRCVERRAVNLLLLGESAPDELVLCTFGRDAAVELRERFAASAQACGIAGPASGVRIATIHGLCHRLLAPHAGQVGLRPGYRVLDEREQHLLLCREFDAIFGPDWGILSGCGVHTVAEAVRSFDRVCDEMVDLEVLADSERPFIVALGRCLHRYRELLLTPGSTGPRTAAVPYHGEMRSREGPVDARRCPLPWRRYSGHVPERPRPTGRRTQAPESHRHHIAASPVGDPQAGLKRSLEGRAEHLSRLHAKCANCPVISYEPTGALY